jgi:thiol-disulfide isomerase/thioredoxin
MLLDQLATGDFRGKDPGPEAAPKADDDTPPRTSGVTLMIDTNGDGKFQGAGESFDVRRPFNIGGTTYEVSDMTPLGSSFKIVKSSKTVAEVKERVVPDHAVGKPITAFEATDAEGKPVKFPSDFKGKIVMLDFWATWCGPCMGEVPGLVTAYNAHHKEGFEILGISLDNAQTKEKMKPVAADKGMTWRQVMDGKGWKAEIAQLYGINSIPAAFLVDGDTGKVLASGDAMRGEELEKTLARALAKKKDSQ